MSRPTFRLALAALALSIAAPGLAAQNCAVVSENFWKNDTLPQVPAGPLATAIIQGLCEGEAAAQVFTLGVGQPLQKINKVAIGFGHPLGASGFNANTDVEIYDGVTFNGTQAILGPKVFDLNDDLQSDMQVVTHGINELDLSGQNIVVGNDPSRKFVIAFRMSINPNGDCPSGFPINFFTDYDGLSTGCTTTPQTSLIDSPDFGGWVDASTAQLLGFNICGGFINAFNGNWVIRACSEDVGGSPTGQFVDLGFGLAGTFAPTLAGNGSLVGGASFNLEWAGLPPFGTTFLVVGVSTLFAPFKGGTLVPKDDLIISLPTGLGALVLPASMPVGLPSNVSIWLQSWTPDAGGPVGFDATNALELITP